MMDICSYATEITCIRNTDSVRLNSLLGRHSGPSHSTQSGFCIDPVNAGLPDEKFGEITGLSEWQSSSIY